MRIYCGENYFFYSHNFFVSVPVLAKTPNKNIFFVGNSYTEFHFDDHGHKIVMNDLPNLIRKMSKNNSIKVAAYIAWGKTLFESLNQEKISEIMATNPNFLVLQEGRYKSPVKAPTRNWFKKTLKNFSTQNTKIILLQRIANSFEKSELKIFQMEQEVCKQFKNCEVVDWQKDGTNITHHRLLGVDGIHPKPLLTWLNSVKIAELIGTQDFNFYNKKTLQELRIWNLNQLKFGGEYDQSYQLRSEILRQIKEDFLFKNHEWLSVGKNRIGYKKPDRKYAEQVFKNFILSQKKYLKIFSLNKMPKILIVAENRMELDFFIRKYLGFYQHQFSRPRLIAVSDGNVSLYLSPRAYKTDSSYSFESKSFKKLVQHETIHLMQYQLQPSFEKQPKFFIEGVPIYFAEQYPYLDEFKQPVIEGIQDKKIPRLSDIKNDIKLSYVWGWTIVKYIDQTMGRAVLLELTRNMNERNFFENLKINEAGFEKKWKIWLMTKNVFKFP